jgi:hypothetical protein
VIVFGSDYLPRHFWPLPSIFPSIAIFFCLCVPPFLVPLSIFFARKFYLHESLFLDKNSNQSCFLDKISNQIDSLILYLIIIILCNRSFFGWVAVAVVDAGGVDGRFRCGAGSIGWVAVAVADAGGVDGQFCCRAGSFWMGGSGCGQCWGSGSGWPVLLWLW